MMVSGSSIPRNAQSASSSSWANSSSMPISMALKYINSLTASLSSAVSSMNKSPTLGKILTIKRQDGKLKGANHVSQ